MMSDNKMTTCFCHQRSCIVEQVLTPHLRTAVPIRISIRALAEYADIRQAVRKQVVQLIDAVDAVASRLRLLAVSV
jgi:hypothetical protein